MNTLLIFLPLLRLSIGSEISDVDEKLPERIIYNLEEADVHFAEFIKEHNKQYDEEEAKYRLEVFKDNLKRFNEWNMDSDHAVYGITPLADLTREEFMSLGSKEVAPHIDYSVDNDNDSLFLNDTYYVIDSFPKDWRKEGVVTDAKDQGSCASSYIFSAIGVIEGQYAMKYGKLVSFSEQQALDCKKTFVCNSTGITASNVLQSMKPDGLTTEAHYPYNQKKGSCKYNKTEAAVFIKIINEFGMDNEIAIAQTLGANGPLAIKLRIPEELQGYKGGIAHPNICTAPLWYTKGLYWHYFLLVGYGQENEKEYWIIKNSWGQKWGEKGFLRLGKGSRLCQIGSSVVHATIY